MLSIAICVALGKWGELSWSDVNESASWYFMEIKETLLEQLDVLLSLPSRSSSICHVDSSKLTVLFITFMAQPGSRRTGLFNCRLWRWLKCGDGDDDDNSNSDAHGVVHWPDHQENCNRYMGNWWIWKLLCKGQTAFNSITIKRLLDGGGWRQLHPIEPPFLLTVWSPC